MNPFIEFKLSLPTDTFQALQRAALREQKTESELALEAIRSYLKSRDIIDPLIGLFADEPKLMDEITEAAMRSRVLR